MKYTVVGLAAVLGTLVLLIIHLQGQLEQLRETLVRLKTSFTINIITTNNKATITMATRGMSTINMTTIINNISTTTTITITTFPIQASPVAWSREVAREEGHPSLIYNRVPKTGSTSLMNVAYELQAQNRWLGVVMVMKVEIVLVVGAPQR